MTKMKVLIYFIMLLLVSRINSIASEITEDMKICNKKVLYQFIISGKGGANYFLWGPDDPYKGWGSDYGMSGEVRMVFNKANIGLGVEGGIIFEKAVANEPISDLPWKWTRTIRRIPILLKF